MAPGCYQPAAGAGLRASVLRIPTAGAGLWAIRLWGRAGLEAFLERDL